MGCEENGCKCGGACGDKCRCKKPVTVLTIVAPLAVALQQNKVPSYAEVILAARKLSDSVKKFNVHAGIPDVNEDPVSRATVVAHWRNRKKQLYGRPSPSR